MAEFGKLNFSVSFNPTSAFPLDARSYFETLTEAQAAATTAGEAGSSTTTYYYGQTLVVVESGVATLYVIQPDKTLKAAGSAVLGDGKSISIVDGTVSLVGFDAAETGAQPRKKKSDGTIEWIKPDTTTVEGLQTAVEGWNPTWRACKPPWIRSPATAKDRWTRRFPTRWPQSSAARRRRMTR